MANITINENVKLGKIKPMHAVGQPPMIGINTQWFVYLKDANIPYSRLHDVGGNFGGNLFVDIPNIFRDFDADENDPESYVFGFTDVLIAGLMKNNCEPVFRLGVTIENYQAIKAFRIYPPKDMAKWARICEHIIRHYNEGWANGFHYGIKYWEIWNEPDGHPDVSDNEMWKGTKEDYFNLYRITSKHLRECFGNSIKIGGYASCGFYAVKEFQDVTGAAFGTTKELTGWERRINYFMEFFHDFVAMVKQEKLPFDFFSHHSYSGVKDNMKMQKYAEDYLEANGFGDIEIHLNEWNTHPDYLKRGSSEACAASVALMCAMQNMKMSMMCYYDAKMGVGNYAGLFNPATYQPVSTYYGFKAFGNLYKAGTQLECKSDSEDVFAVAATDGKMKNLLISNIGSDTEIQTNIDFPCKAYIIERDRFLEEVTIDAKCFKLASNQVIYIESI